MKKVREGWGRMEEDEKGQKRIEKDFGRKEDEKEQRGR